MQMSVSSIEATRPPVADLVAEGIHEAELTAVQHFSNSHGQRIAFVFEIAGGQHDGRTVVQSAAPSFSPFSKLADILR